MTDSTMPPADDTAAYTDQAAEIDDSVPSDSTEGDYTPADPMFSGVCKGGPYDGRTVHVRYPSGFVLFDKLHSRMWTYSSPSSEPGVFTVLDPDSATVPNVENLRAAANGASLDLLAYDNGPALA